MDLEHYVGHGREEAEKRGKNDLGLVFDVDPGAFENVLMDLARVGFGDGDGDRRLEALTALFSCFRSGTMCPEIEGLREVFVDGLRGFLGGDGVKEVGVGMVEAFGGWRRATGVCELEETFEEECGLMARMLERLGVEGVDGCGIWLTWVEGVVEEGVEGRREELGGGVGLDRLGDVLEGVVLEKVGEWSAAKWASVVAGIEACRGNALRCRAGQKRPKTVPFRAVDVIGALGEMEEGDDFVERLRDCRRWKEEEGMVVKTLDGKLAGILVEEVVKGMEEPNVHIAGCGHVLSGVCGGVLGRKEGVESVVEVVQRLWRCLVEWDGKGTEAQGEVVLTVAKCLYGVMRWTLECGMVDELAGAVEVTVEDFEAVRTKSIQIRSPSSRVNITRALAKCTASINLLLPSLYPVPPKSSPVFLSALVAIATRSSSKDLPSIITHTTTTLSSALPQLHRYSPPLQRMLLTAVRDTASCILYLNAIKSLSLADSATLTAPLAAQIPHLPHAQQTLAITALATAYLASHTSNPPQEHQPSVLEFFEHQTAKIIDGESEISTECSFASILAHAAILKLPNNTTLPTESKDAANSFVARAKSSLESHSETLQTDEDRAVLRCIIHNLATP